MTDVDHTPVILAATRTPIGKYLGGLAPLKATHLGSIAIREAVKRAGIEPGAVEEVIMGHVLQGGTGQAPARQAALGAGLPGTVAAFAVNKVCGSGLKAVMLGAQAIKAGDAQCIVAGGMESMSRGPHYVYGLRGGVKFGHQQLTDGVIHDGLWCSFGDNHMGSYAEYTAQKAVAAMEACRFAEEIVRVEIPGKKGPTVVDRDESPRKDTSLEALAALKPAFEKGGTVTAGNAPGMNDGASAVVLASAAFAQAHGLPVLARVTAYATGAGGRGARFLLPIQAVRNLMAKAGTAIGDYEVIEANEAFAVQALADGRGLGWDWDRVNVNGGAVALGHPI